MDRRKLSDPMASRCGIKAMGIEKPLEKLYNVRVEKNASKARLAQLGISRWSVWKTGKAQLLWDWQVDQLVYIEEGEVKVVPEGNEHVMRFVVRDLVRYLKWFEVDLLVHTFLVIWQRLISIDACIFVQF